MTKISIFVFITIMLMTTSVLRSDSIKEIDPANEEIRSYLYMNG